MAPLDNWICKTSSRFKLNVQSIARLSFTTSNFYDIADFSPAALAFGFGGPWAHSNILKPKPAVVAVAEPPVAAPAAAQVVPVPAAPVQAAAAAEAPAAASLGRARPVALALAPLPSAFTRAAMHRCLLGAHLRLLHVDLLQAVLLMRRFLATRLESRRAELH